MVVAEGLNGLLRGGDAQSCGQIQNGQARLWLQGREAVPVREEERAGVVAVAGAAGMVQKQSTGVAFLPEAGRQGRWQPAVTKDPLLRKHGALGQSISRIEGPMKVQGRTRFAAPLRGQQSCDHLPFLVRQIAPSHCLSPKEKL